MSGPTVLSCRHLESTGTTGKNTNNIWLNPKLGYVAGSVVVVVCPRKFKIGIKKNGMKQLQAWAGAGYPNGALVINPLLWILWPDPGCEL